jgi:hypothetical protein
MVMVEDGDDEVLDLVPLEDDDEEVEEDEVELEELEVDGEEDSGDDWEVLVGGGGPGVEEGEEEGEDGLGVLGGGVCETTEDDPLAGSRDGVGLEMAGTEIVELPERLWRLCNQCRFSSTS